MQPGGNIKAIMKEGGGCLKIHESPAGDNCDTWTKVYVGQCGGGPSLANSFSLINSTLESIQCKTRCVTVNGDGSSISLGPCTAASGWSASS